MKSKVRLFTPSALCIFALPAFALLSASAYGQGGDTRKTIQSLYDSHVRAFKAKDVPALMSLLTPDFTVADSGGRVASRTSAEAGYKQTAAKIKSVSAYTLSITKFQADGRQAVAWTSIKFAGVVSDAQGKIHNVVETAPSKDTWVKTPAGWKIQHSEAGQLTVVMDGKPFPVPNNLIGGKR